MRFTLACWSLVFALATRALAALPVVPQTATAPHVMIVASHPEAVDAGLAVLRAGGNAMDAAVAVSLALGVAEPYGSGLGGKLVLLHYASSTRTVSFIDGMDAASLSLPVKAFLAAPPKEREEGGPSIATPGLPHALWMAHQRWGRLTWGKSVQPAIDLADRGALVLPKTIELIAESRKRLEKDPDARRLFLPGDALPRAGTRLAQPALARTLQRYADEGPAAIYHGTVADAIVAASRQAGGYVTREDLAAYVARESPPLSTPFHDGHLYAPSAPMSGGATVLTTLSVLRATKWQPGPLRSAANLDLLGRAFAAVYPTVNDTAGDASDAAGELQALLAPAVIERIRERTTRPLAPTKTAPGVPASGSHTTHFVVVDRERNIVCATQSLSFHFGSGYVAAGTGIVLNNSLSNFTTASVTHPNYPAPGRRARSTVTPVLWLDADRRPRLAIGLPGGQRIPTGLVQVLLDTAVFRRPLSDAVADLRVHFFNGAGDPLIECESEIPPALATALGQRGWKVKPFEPAGTGVHFGGVNAIEFLPDGTLRGIADQRRTNAARGE